MNRTHHQTPPSQQRAIAVETAAEFAVAFVPPASCRLLALVSQFAWAAFRRARRTRRHRPSLPSPKPKRHRLAATAAIAILALFLLPANLRGVPPERIHLTPNFTMGQSFRYHIESRTTTTGITTTPIVNPEAASQLKQVADLQLRLDVLGVQPGANGAPQAYRLRATYEKATASTETDAYDPAATSLDDQYNRLQGRYVEFTIEPGGKISHVTGLDDVLSNPSAANTMRNWLDGFSPSANLPRDGIAIGQKWDDERPLDHTPLANLLWRTQSTYLRDEPCELPDASAPPAQKSAANSAAAQPLCAVLLTRFEILRHGSAGSDATPEDYRHNGLRTSGTWTGQGQSLDDVSLRTGMLVRSTQTSSQQMDFEIVSAISGSKIHYAGKIETQSEITQLPNVAPAQP